MEQEPTFEKSSEERKKEIQKEFALNLASASSAEEIKTSIRAYGKAMKDSFNDAYFDPEDADNICWYIDQGLEIGAPYDLIDQGFGISRAIARVSRPQGDQQHQPPSQEPDIEQEPITPEPETPQTPESEKPPKPSDILKDKLENATTTEEIKDAIKEFAKAMEDSGDPGAFNTALADKTCAQIDSAQEYYAKNPGSIKEDKDKKLLEPITRYFEINAVVERVLSIEPEKIPTPAEIRKKHTEKLKRELEAGLKAATSIEGIKEAVKASQESAEAFGDGTPPLFGYDRVCELLDEIEKDGTKINKIAKDLRDAVKRVLGLDDARLEEIENEKKKAIEAKGKYIREIPFRNGKVINGYITTSTGTTATIEFPGGRQEEYPRSELLYGDTYMYSQGKDADQRKLKAEQDRIDRIVQEVQNGPTLQGIIKERDGPATESFMAAGQREDMLSGMEESLDAEVGTADNTKLPPVSPDASTEAAGGDESIASMPKGPETRESGVESGSPEEIRTILRHSTSSIYTGIDGAGHKGFDQGSPDKPTVSNGAGSAISELVKFTTDRDTETTRILQDEAINSKPGSREKLFIIPSANPENARLIYKAVGVHEWIDASNRGGQEIVVAVEGSIAEISALAEIISNNPNTVRVLAKQVVIEQVGIDETTWKTGSDRTAGHPLRPPYEVWDSESATPSIFVYSEIKTVLPDIGRLNLTPDQPQTTETPIQQPEGNIPTEPVESAEPPVASEATSEAEPNNEEKTEAVLFESKLKSASTAEEIKDAVREFGRATETSDSALSFGNKHYIDNICRFIDILPIQVQRNENLINLLPNDHGLRDAVLRVLGIPKNPTITTPEA